MNRQGNIAILVLLLLPVLLGFVAFATDVGRIAHAQSQLQAAADAAAMAAVEDLPDGNTAITSAQTIGGLNLADKENIVASQDVEFGNWNDKDQTFTVSSAETANAVRVTARLCDDSGNALQLFFGGILGVSKTNVSASAIATLAEDSGIGTRFLIDDEMIGKDVTAIGDLANDLGRDAEELVTARGFNDGKEYGDSDWTWEDNFLDIPAGTELTLPTGQGTNYDNNDAGLFDIDHPDFPFTDPADFQDFVMYSESGGDSSKWGTDSSNIANNLDPLEGVSPITDQNQYDSFVNPDFTHISPITTSDVSTLNMDGGTPQVNAKGLRRGLMAFKIIGVGDDIDGSGSVLPELIIEIVDPSTISFADIKPMSAGAASSRLRLVK